MVDKISKERRSRNMQAIKSKGMKPEMVVRKLVHAMGYRYRLHGKGLPGKPDLVFSPKKKVIFVHGCFWHQHKSKKCKIKRVPKSNTEFWLNKLGGNASRDRAHLSALKKIGWDCLTIWECETEKGGAITEKIRSFLGEKF